MDRLGLGPEIMRQPIVRAGSDGTAPYRSRHYLPFRWLHFLPRADPRREKNLFVFRTVVGHRPWTGDNFPRRGKYTSSSYSFERRWEKVYKGDNKGNGIFSNDLESVFFSFSSTFYPSLWMVNVNISFAAKHRLDKFEENFGEICSGSARLIFRNASRAVQTREFQSHSYSNKTTLWARSDVGNHTPLYSIFQVIVASRV